MPASSPDSASTGARFRDWHFGALDPADAEAVRAYEESLFTAFAPILKINPLVRNLWEWDDANQRLRTRVPYADQFVALMRHATTDAVAFSVGVNLRPDRFWQSGAYGFPAPAANEHACEFLILAGGAREREHVAVVNRHFIHGYFFGELRQQGFRCAYGTCADHLRRLYLFFGATIADERTVDGFRRTLLRWDLNRVGPPS